MTGVSRRACLLPTTGLSAHLSRHLRWTFTHETGLHYVGLRFSCAVSDFGQRFISFGTYLSREDVTAGAGHAGATTASKSVMARREREKQTGLCVMRKGRAGDPFRAAT